MIRHDIRKFLCRATALVLAVCLVSGLTGCGGGKKTAAGKTPEETLEIFFQALSRQDVDGMMACCYIEDYLDRVSFAQYTDRTKTYLPTNGISAPTEYDLYRKTVGYQLRANFARSFQILTFSLLATDEEYQDLLEFRPIGDVDRDWAKDFSRAVDPGALKDLKILRIDEDRSDMQDDPRVEENFLRSTGADDVVERTVLLELDGQLFCKGFTLAEVDGRWQIYTVSALLLGENSMGGASPVDSEQEYRDLIQ